MVKYSIMPMNVKHVEETCQDIKEQYENNIADLALFSMSLVPEGNPVTDKAEKFCKIYDLFRNRLAEMGLKCGILFQSSIGHGYALNEVSPFQRCVNLSDGETVYRYCPYDEDVREHFKGVMEKLASHEPAAIMVDDDMRLLSHFGKGCACPLHMAEFNKRAGTDINREQLYEIIMNPEHEDCIRFRQIFEEIQDDSLSGLVMAMREGIDKVNPRLQASICTAGTDPHGEMAHILAGEGNPSIMRMNNGAYSTPGMREISFSMYRAALQKQLLCNKVDIYLAETDTCPQNRYSTSAYYLHSHFVGTILEGASGAKHWITRTIDYEPESGVAYRKVLSKYAGMYSALADIYPSLNWRGCNIPLPDKMPYAFELPPFHYPHNSWATKVLERLGLPLYFSAKPQGAMFIDDDYDKYFDDKQIEEFFKGTVILSAAAAEKLNLRGFGSMTGVQIKEWSGKPANTELLLINGRKCQKQYKHREIIPKNDDICVLSQMVHRKQDGSDEIVAPACVEYKNPLGGNTIVFCGSPNAEFHYTVGFSFLSYSRKLQFIDILKRSGNLPVYYTGDAEVYMKAADMPDGKLFCAVFNIGMDAIEELSLGIERDIHTAQMMMPDGQWNDVSFSKEDGKYIVHTPANILTPVILKFE